MSFINDIQTAVTNRSPFGDRQQTSVFGTGQQPGGPTAAQGLATTFKSTFSNTMSTVYERGVSGGFDDRTLALEEQAALQRLLIAQKAAGVKPVGTDNVPGGSNAGPDAGTVTGGGASAGPDATHVAIAEQRELYGVRVRQSEARLKNISTSLKSDFPLAAKLVSASSGAWDPETFVPRTREEAEALAQRLVIDATEGAARLEIVKTQLDAAKFELSQRGGAELTKLVGDLEAAYERQKTYVDKLARVVDRHSSGQMTDAGEDALAGRTMRGANDLPVDEIAAALRAEGATEAEIKRVVGALEVSVEQEKSPDGSPRLKAMANDMSRQLLENFNRRVDEMRDAREQREEEQRMEDKRADKKRADRQIVDQKAAQRAAQRDADWQQWIARLAQESRSKAG